MLLFQAGFSGNNISALTEERKSGAIITENLFVLYALQTDLKCLETECAFRDSLNRNVQFLLNLHTNLFTCLASKQIWFAHSRWNFGAL